MAWFGWILSRLEFTTIFLFCFFVFLVYILKSWVERPKNLPPCPAPPHFLLGHVPYLRKGMRDIISKWSKETGEIFSVYLGQDLQVYLSGFDIIKEAFVKQADVFSDRPQNLVAKCQGIKEDLGIVRSSGQIWKVQRTVSQAILRQFGMGKNFLALKIQEEVGFFLAQLATFNGQPKDVRILTANSVSNNICSIIMGRRFDYDDPDFTSLIQLIDEYVNWWLNGDRT